MDSDLPPTPAESRRSLMNGLENRTRNVIAREHFAKARQALNAVDYPAALPADEINAAAQLAMAHLRAATFAKNWDSTFGGDLLTGEPT